MAKKFDTALNSRIKSFIKKFNISSKIKDEDVFEEFSNYIIASNEAQKEIVNFNDISTNKAEGIDGIAIFVNGNLITDESHLDNLGENEKINVKLCFIQSTIQSSFDNKKFKAYVDKVIEFLIGDFYIEPFSGIYKKLLSEESDFFDNLTDKPEIIIYFSSGKTNHQLNYEDINKERKKFEREDLSMFLLKDIKILQKEELVKMYDNINKFYTVEVKFDNVMQLKEKENIPISLVSVFNVGELTKIILTSEGHLREHLFVENPRHYIGDTEINKSIMETLQDENLKEYFIYLNNGLTILCDDIKRHPIKEKTYILQYPRIINGCQTTHVLYEAMKKGIDINKVEIIAKLIATKDNDALKEKIIFTTNNQNSISKDLQSLNSFLKDLEEFFNGYGIFEIYFERLRGQYSNVNPPYKKINIENLAKVYISIFKRQPHLMKSKALKKIEEYQKRNEIFATGDKKENYYYCAILFYWLNKKIINKEIILKSKTMDMHFLLTADLILANKFNKKNIDEKLKFIIKEENIDKLFKEVNQFLEKQKYLFERRGFYSSPKTKKLIESIKKEFGNG
jgi:hypothetical protein